jgi:alkylation response protein AidB-like acyl-CoA dehydrogenase
VFSSLAWEDVDEDFVQRADAFAAKLAPLAHEEPQNRFQGMPSDGDSRAINSTMGREGWIGLHWPVDLGGRGMSAKHTLAAEERFGYHWLPLSGYLLSVKTIGNAMLRFASRDLQRSLLPEIAAGELVFCQGFSEPEAGSDLASLRTRARRDGDRWIVNGHKIWTSSAQLADWIYLAVRTEDHDLAHRGLSVVVADMRTPGIEVREIETLGGGVLCEVFLRDVEVPVAQTVGEPGSGWAVLMGTLDYERVTSEKLGAVLRMMDDLDALMEAPSERRTLRRFRGEAQAARLHGHHATALLADGRRASAAAAMAKNSIALIAQRLGEWAVEQLGPEVLVERGPGALLDGRLAAFHRASVASTISGGALEIQRRVIARRGLGCPA